MRAYVGADWSATKVVCSVAVGDGRVRGIRGCARTLADVTDLVQRVRQRHPEATEVHVLLEAGANGWLRLFDAAGGVVHVADPKQAKRFAESLSSSGAKDDRRDSATLTHMLRSPAHCPQPWSSKPDLEPLERFAGAHEQVTKEIVRCQQQLRDLMREHMPLVDSALKDLRRQWARRVLRQVPTPWHASQLDSEDRTALFRGVRKKSRIALQDAFSQTEAPWLTQTLAQAEALRIRMLLDRLDILLDQLDELDDAIDQATEQLPVRGLLESVPGIAMRQAATLIQHAFGDVLSHRDQAGIRLGACGQPQGHARMRRSAHHRGRRATYLLGRLAARHHSWARAMYQDGRARGQKAATAYRRIARSMLRILTAMVRNNETYDEARYIAALKARGVPWALDLNESP